METLPGSLLLAISSPFARRGAMHEAYKRHYGRDGDSKLVWKATSRELNPNISEETVEAALEEDPSAARAEWLAEFRRDIESFVSREAVEAVVVPGRFELAPVSGVTYSGFVDCAGGSGGGDSAALAIAYAEDRDGETIAVLDLLREVKPPFAPSAVIEDFAADLLRYDIHEVTGDRWAGGFPPESFSKCNVEYRQSEKPKSDLYRDLLPLLNSGRCELLDNARLISQLCGLERRVARGGKDSIDHAPSRALNSSEGRDDVSNAAAGALVGVALVGANFYNLDVLIGDSRAELRSAVSAFFGPGVVRR
jgi:hypothetical protein